jgi:hypothetical protein
MANVVNIQRSALYVFPMMLVLVVLGFWPSYFASLQTWRLSVHIHSALMFYWMGALIAQASFVKTGRMDWHRRIGRTTFVIAPLIVFFGFLMMREALDLDSWPLSFSHIRPIWAAFGTIVQFALTYALAIYYRRETQLHARYMISTGIVLLDAGTIRIFWIGQPDMSGFVAAENASFIFVALLTVALILNDRRIGRIWAPFVITLVLLACRQVVFTFWTAPIYP